MNRTLRWLAACSSCCSLPRRARRSRGWKSTSSAATPPRCRSRWCRCRTRAPAPRRTPTSPAVIRADLDRSGQFRGAARARHRRAPDPRQRGQLPDLARAEAGLPRRRPRGRRRRRRLPRRIRTVRRRQAAAPARLRDDRAAPTRMRDVAHQIADAIYEKILGVRGAFWTRIAYVTASGVGNDPQLRADGRRLRRLQPADRRALARAAAVAGVEPGRPQAGLRQLRARQFVDLHPGHRQRRARAGRELPRHQQRAGVLARRPQPGDDAVEGRQSRDLRDGPGQQAADAR